MSYPRSLSENYIFERLVENAHSAQKRDEVPRKAYLDSMPQSREARITQPFGSELRAVSISNGRWVFSDSLLDEKKRERLGGNFARANAARHAVR